MRIHQASLEESQAKLATVPSLCQSWYLCHTLGPVYLGHLLRRRTLEIKSFCESCYFFRRYETSYLSQSSLLQLRIHKFNLGTHENLVTIMIDHSYSVVPPTDGVTPEDPTKADPSPPPSRAHLLEIPAELRLKIYGYLALVRCTQPHSDSEYIMLFGEDGQRISISHPLLRSCKLISNEFLSVFY